MTVVSDGFCEAATSNFVTSIMLGVCLIRPHSYKGRISSDMMCAGGAPVKESCKGDSGGPFTVKNRDTNQHQLAGVVSWGKGCAAVSILLQDLSIRLLIFRMDCTECMLRCQSTGLGLMRRLL